MQLFPRDSGPFPTAERGACTDEHGGFSWSALPVHRLYRGVRGAAPCHGSWPAAPPEQKGFALCLCSGRCVLAGEPAAEGGQFEPAAMSQAGWFGSVQVHACLLPGVLRSASSSSLSLAEDLRCFAVPADGER